MLLRGARLADGSSVDVRVIGTTIREVAAAGRLPPKPDEECLDLSRYVLLAAPAEPHAHLDKALAADVVGNASGDLLGAVAAWHEYRRTLSGDDILRRARAAALLALGRGATAIRTHVDVGEGIELRGALALLQLKDEVRDLIDLQVVALSYPLSGAAGSQNRTLLKEALAAGVDIVGGAPHIDPKPREHMEICLDTACMFQRPVDLHMDEHLRETCDLAGLAQLVSAGFPHPVTASHCVSLGRRPLDVQASIAAAVAAAGISVVTLPATNLYLQGRDQPVSMPRGLTPIHVLLEAGVNVAGGGDNVQDPFNALGCGDPLHTGQLLVFAGQLSLEEAYRLVSSNARMAMGLPQLDVVPGSPADLVAVAGSSLREVMATVTEDRIVMRHGRVIVRTELRRTYEGIAVAGERLEMPGAETEGRN
jgi:cytosine/creatinine deaminase